MEQEQKTKTMEATAKNLYYIAIPSFIVSFYLIFMSVKYIILVPVNFYLQLMSGFLPLCLALLILFSIVFVIIANVRRKIIITPDEFEYQDYFTKKFVVTWKQLMVIKVTETGYFLRYCILSNGKKYIELSNFFFPNFDLIVRVIETAKQNIETREDYKEFNEFNI